MDENILPGGQLFKQIHKFFGSEYHFSGVRGLEIGNILLRQAEEAGVEIKLNSRVIGLLEDGSVPCQIDGVLKTIKPKKFLMLGSGNVGLIVAYHLIQAGAEVAGIVDIAKEISGYRVHADKIKREKIPVYLNSIIIRASGTDRVESALISSNINFDVDCILLAVGLTPQTNLASLFGCRLIYSNG